MSGDVGARRQAASEHVRALFGPAPEGALVEVRFRVPSGMAQRFMPGNGQHLHPYWFLQEPVDLDRLEHLNRRLAAALGAAGGVVTKPHTILRPAGSLNRKHAPPAPVRLIGLQEGHRPGADEIDAQLPRERTESALTSHPGLSRASSPSLRPIRCGWWRRPCISSG